MRPSGGKKTGKNPTDRAKRGVKRSLLVEGHGIPIGLAVDGANRPDMKMAEETLDSIPVERPEPTAEEKQNLCLDKGYAYDEVRQIAEEFGFTAHIPAKGQEAQQVKREAGKKARRWVVERTHSWMNRFRGILIRWCKKAENYIALLHMAFAFIIYRRMGLSG
jgi:putative transposase